MEKHATAADVLEETTHKCNPKRHSETNWSLGDDTGRAKETIGHVEEKLKKIILPPPPHVFLYTLHSQFLSSIVHNLELTRKLEARGGPTLRQTMDNYSPECVP